MTLKTVFLNEIISVDAWYAQMKAVEQTETFNESRLYWPSLPSKLNPLGLEIKLEKLAITDVFWSYFHERIYGD